jgi:hypothetical protein
MTGKSHLSIILACFHWMCALRRCLFSREHMARIDPGDMAKGLTAEGSGRVATYLSHGLIHSYTLECNYNTGRVGNEVPPTLDEENNNAVVTANTTCAANYTGNPEKYSPASYASVGRACIVAMLDVRGLNKSSRIPKSKYKTLERLRQFVAAEVRGRREYRNQAQGTGNGGSIQQMCREKRNSSKPSIKDGGYGDIPWRRVAAEFGSEASSSSNGTTPTFVDSENEYPLRPGEPTTATMINFTSIADSYGPGNSVGGGSTLEPEGTKGSSSSKISSKARTTSACRRKSSRKFEGNQPRADSALRDVAAKDSADDNSVMALDGSEQGAQATNRQVEPKVFSFPCDSGNINSVGRPKPGGVKFRPVMPVGEDTDVQAAAHTVQGDPRYTSRDDSVGQLSRIANAHSPPNGSAPLPPSVRLSLGGGKTNIADRKISKTLKAAGAALLLAQTMQKSKQLVASVGLCRQKKHRGGRNEEEWTVMLTEEQARQQDISERGPTEDNVRFDMASAATAVLCTSSS